MENTDRGYHAKEMRPFILKCSKYFKIILPDFPARQSQHFPWTTPILCLVKIKLCQRVASFHSPNKFPNKPQLMWSFPKSSRYPQAAPWNILHFIGGESSKKNHMASHGKYPGGTRGVPPTWQPGNLRHLHAGMKTSFPWCYPWLTWWSAPIPTDREPGGEFSTVTLGFHGDLEHESDLIHQDSNGCHQQI